MKTSVREFGVSVSDAPLWRVLTVPEVCALWGKGYKTVMMAIYTDRLSARLSITGGSWLVDTVSVFRLWGDVKYPELLKGDKS